MTKLKNFRYFYAIIDKLGDENAELRAEILKLRAELRELIVQCGNCENAKEHNEDMDVWWCEYHHMYVRNNDFCGWSKRRKER